MYLSTSGKRIITIILSIIIIRKQLSQLQNGLALIHFLAYAYILVTQKFFLKLGIKTKLICTDRKKNGKNKLAQKNGSKKMDENKQNSYRIWEKSGFNFWMKHFIKCRISSSNLSGP